jgi:hypothetical protein
MTLDWLYIHFEVEYGQQEMNPFRLGHEHLRLAKRRQAIPGDRPA